MRDAETGSLWSHLLGKAMRGLLAGTELELLAGSMTDWKTWRDEHPDTTVVMLSRTAREFRREFYKQHLGMTVIRDGGERNCFMSCGRNNFVALFKGEEASMDHYCYSIQDFDVGKAEAKLKAEGIEPRVVRDGGRIYFPDPDGLTVQLAASDHRP